MTMFTMDACSLITGDKCDETIIPFEEPIIYLKLAIDDYYPPNDTHLTTDAEKAFFTGSITKVYCDGKRSGSFSFNHTLFLSRDYTKEFLSEGIFLSQPYQFKFTNSDDYLEVVTQIKLFFKDGKIFESTAGTQKFYHFMIWYDVNRMDKFINVTLPSPRGWKDVTK